MMPAFISLANKPVVRSVPRNYTDYVDLFATLNVIISGGFFSLMPFVVVTVLET